MLAAKNSVTYDIQEIRFPWWRNSEKVSGVQTLTEKYDIDMGNPLKPVGIEKYEYYVKNKFDYIIVHSKAYDRFFKDNEVSKNFPSHTSFYHDLFSKGILIKEFSPDKGNRPGPTIKIFRLSNSPLGKSKGHDNFYNG